jgi:hypothetical protein
MFDNMPSALPMAKEGKIRALAQTTAQRSQAAPDVPTVAETVPGFEATTWFAMFAPAGTPREVVARLNAELQRVFKLPEVVEKMKTLGLETWISTPVEQGGAGVGGPSGLTFCRESADGAPGPRRLAPPESPQQLYGIYSMNAT